MEPPQSGRQIPVPGFSREFFPQIHVFSRSRWAEPSPWWPRDPTGIPWPRNASNPTTETRRSSRCPGSRDSGSFGIVPVGKGGRSSLGLFGNFPLNSHQNSREIPTKFPQNSHEFEGRDGDFGEFQVDFLWDPVWICGNSVWILREFHEGFRESLGTAQAEKPLPKKTRKSQI